MLHAIVQHKTSHFRHYLGERTEGSGRVREEDEITSIFLGPLDFMEPTLVYHFFGQLFRLADQSHVLPKVPPLSCELHLWPSLEGGDDRLRIEPDAHLCLLWPDDRQIDILIEFKWRAPLSGKDQLHQQWLAFQRQHDKRNTWHFFIGLDISDGAKAKNSQEGNPWMVDKVDHLALISWAQIRDALSMCFNGHHNLSKWAKMSDSFLEAIGIRKFKGFDLLDTQATMLTISKKWHFSGLDHGFKGFFQHNYLLPSMGCNHQYFFKE